MPEMKKLVFGDTEFEVVDGESRDRLDDHDTAIASKAEASALAVEKARIDGIIALPDGSTTADAELVDIRTGYDGVNYRNAGNSVRSQVAELKNNIDAIGTFDYQYINQETLAANTTWSYNSTDGFYQSSATGSVAADAFHIKAGTYYVIGFNGFSSQFMADDGTRKTFYQLFNIGQSNTVRELTFNQSGTVYFVGITSSNYTIRHLFATNTLPDTDITGVYNLLYDGVDITELNDTVNDHSSVLPHRITATRDTSGDVQLTNYRIQKGHSYYLVNPNSFSCSFSPMYDDGTASALGSTTINANSVNMRVSEIDGYAGVWFGGANAELYICDMDCEIKHKGITDLNEFAINAIISSRYKTSNNAHLLSLIHFSDIHADSTGLRRLINFQTDMQDYIDDAICTGDITSSKFGDGLTFWTNSEGAEKILTCVGNHDSYYTNSMDANQMVPMSTLAGAYIDPFASNWGTIIRPSNCTYYYKDYESGYRLIVLDSIRITSEAEAEATWLESVLNDALTNNLAVIIAMHYMPTGSMHIHDCRFSKYSEIGDSGNICNAPNFAVEELVQDFINDGGKFMCYLIGHLHRDIFGYVTGYPQQLCVMVTTASASKAASEVNADLGRVIGEKSQDAFNVVTFDKDNNMVKVIRVGADIDHLMRLRKAVSYNTSSGEFIQK